MIEQQPEFKDIKEAIRRYCAVNQESVFICGLLAFNSDGTPRQDSNGLFAFGFKEELYSMLKQIVVMIKENEDEYGFVNI